MKIKKRKDAPKAFQFSYMAGFARRETEAWVVPNSNGLFCVGTLGPNWAVWHIPTGQSLLLAPSKEYALQLAENVFEKLDLFPLSKLSFADKISTAVPDWVANYLADIWRTQPSLSEIPTVEKWQSSKSSKTSRPLVGKLRVKVKRKK